MLCPPSIEWLMLQLTAVFVLIISGCSEALDLLQFHVSAPLFKITDELSKLTRHLAILEFVSMLRPNNLNVLKIANPALLINQPIATQNMHH
jgi:hypothetical protein